MLELTNGSITTAVTSPPYNRGKVYECSDGTICNDNKSMEEYAFMLNETFREVHRVLVDDGVFFLNVGDSAYDKYKSFYVLQQALNQDFYHLDTIIWVKSLLGRGHYTPSGRGRRLNNIWEYVFVLTKNEKDYSYNPKAIGIPYADKSNIGRYADEDLRDAGNVWFIPYERTVSKHIPRFQDSVFPVKLPYNCLKLADAKSVVDPFAGSCTTLLAAEYLGIEGYGYEKYPNRDGVVANMLREIDDTLFTTDDLLPHIELVIKYLTKIISGKAIRDSRKSRMERQIVNEYLEKHSYRIRV